MYAYTSADQTHEAHSGGPDPTVARPLVYLTVTVGVVAAVVALLLSQGTDLDLAVPLLALLAAVPYLVFARMAMARPGFEAVVAAVLLVTVGTWGYIAAWDSGRSACVMLPLLLTAVVLAVFLGGAALRQIGRRAPDSEPG